MKDFLEIITKRTRGYDGPHKQMIVNLEHLYVLVNKLVAREALPERQRVFALAVIGYFSVLDDVVSAHDFGAKGYLDDAYLCCVVLQHYRNILGDEGLYDYWEGDIDLKALLGSPFDELEKDLGSRVQRILTFSGVGTYLNEVKHE